MMCWNSKRKCYTTKGRYSVRRGLSRKLASNFSLVACSTGMNIDVKSLRVDHVNKPCFCVFDILFLNGQILTNKPLKERIELLEEVINSEEGVIMTSVVEIVESRWKN